MIQSRVNNSGNHYYQLLIQWVTQTDYLTIGSASVNLTQFSVTLLPRLGYWLSRAGVSNNDNNVLAPSIVVKIQITGEEEILQTI